MMPQPSSPKRARLSRGRGFSVVAVLISMTVLAIGASAVMSMQKATVQGDMDARETDIANAIARTWVERLQRETLRWTVPSSIPPLLQVTGAWFLPNIYMSTFPDM